MVESELGLIPKGWEVTRLRCFTSNVLGGDWAILGNKDYFM